MLAAVLASQKTLTDLATAWIKKDMGRDNK
jgi:hypothetical protein